jgi:hypothetical protein
MVPLWVGEGRIQSWAIEQGLELVGGHEGVVRWQAVMHARGVRCPYLRFDLE